MKVSSTDKRTLKGAVEQFPISSSGPRARARGFADVIHSRLRGAEGKHALTGPAGWCGTA
jgi:hypothetical protein